MLRLPERWYQNPFYVLLAIVFVTFIAQISYYGVRRLFGNLINAGVEETEEKIPRLASIGRRTMEEAFGKSGTERTPEQARAIENLSDAMSVAMLKASENDKTKQALRNVVDSFVKQFGAGSGDNLGKIRICALAQTLGRTLRSLPMDLRVKIPLVKLRLLIAGNNLRDYCKGLDAEVAKYMEEEKEKEKPVQKVFDEGFKHITMHTEAPPCRRFSNLWDWKFSGRCKRMKKLCRDWNGWGENAGGKICSGQDLLYWFETYSGITLFDLLIEGVQQGLCKLPGNPDYEFQKENWDMFVCNPKTYVKIYRGLGRDFGFNKNKSITDEDLEVLFKMILPGLSTMYKGELAKQYREKITNAIKFQKIPKKKELPSAPPLASPSAAPPSRYPNLSLAKSKMKSIFDKRLYPHLSKARSKGRALARAFTRS